MIRCLVVLMLAAFVAAGPARADEAVSLELIFETHGAAPKAVADVFRARLDPYAPDTVVEIQDGQVRVTFWGVQRPDWWAERLSLRGTFGLHEVVSEAPDCSAPPAQGLVCAAPTLDGQAHLWLHPASLRNDAIVQAEPGFDHQGLPVVNVRLSSDAAQVFGEMTARLMGKRIAIVYEDTILTAPVVQTPILGGAMMISGGFSGEEASDLAVMLSTPALPDGVELVSQRTGPVQEPPKKSLLQRLFD